MVSGKIKAATDQRTFTIVYDDFLESNLLERDEKLIFIAIKKYSDNKTLKAFPSVQAIHNITGYSKPWIRKCIAHMAKLGVLSVEHRKTDKGNYQTNIYTLHDSREIWNASSSEEIKQAIEADKKNKAIQILSDMGYQVNLQKIEQKERSLAPEPAKDQKQDHTKNFSTDNNYISEPKESQDQYCYAVEEIQQQFGYEILRGYPENMFSKDDLDAVFQIITDVMNKSNDSYINIKGDKKTAKEVKDKIRNLEFEDIAFAIDQFNSQASYISNPVGYIITLLYFAKEDHTLKTHNLYNVNKDYIN